MSAAVARFVTDSGLSSADAASSDVRGAVAGVVVGCISWMRAGAATVALAVGEDGVVVGRVATLILVCAGAATGVAVDASEIVRRAGAGDAAAQAALARYERRMAKALASVINLLDPDVIVLGGGMSNIEQLYGRVPEIWGDYVFGATSANSAGGKAPAAQVRTRLVRAEQPCLEEL